jgi:hypothetical protein
MKLDEGRMDGHTHVYGISVMSQLMQFVQTALLLSLPVLPITVKTEK